jgi:predicted NAD-dependent protein-ADP-ribosyltransferase YbiA (DUF1768 family)
MVTLKNEVDEAIYQDAILRGLRARFAQYPRLRERLIETRGRELVYGDSNIVALLNNIRSDTSNVYDPLQRTEVPRSLVLRVVDGVSRELLKNPTLSDDLPFTELVRYALRTTNMVLPEKDKIFININNIVPILKFKMREQIWEQEVDRFKKHLLDVYLDYLLRTEYPHVKEEEYALAKRQQIEKEPRVHVYENSLYDMWKRNDIGTVVLNKLLFTPDAALQERTEREKEMEILLATPEILDETAHFQIPEGDPFLPEYMEQVKMEGRVHASAVHYAYWKLFQEIQAPAQISNIPISNLRDVYREAREAWFYNTLKKNNENATVAKLEQHADIKQLLKQLTWVEEIIWNDKTDPVLGSGGSNKTNNMAGQCLMFFKHEMPPLTVPFKAPNVMTDSAFTTEWLFTRCKNLKLLLQLTTNVTTKEIAYFYNIELFTDTPSLHQADAIAMKKAGLTDEQISILYPIIAVMYDEVKRMKDPILLMVEGSHVMRKRPKKENYKAAEQWITDRAPKSRNVKMNVFISSMLAGKKTTRKQKPVWYRLYMFSDLQNGY